MQSLKSGIEMWGQNHSLLVLLSFTYGLEEMVPPLSDCRTLPVVQSFSENTEYVKYFIELSYLRCENFASHPFVFFTYGSWKARGVGYNWKCLRPLLKKLQYQSPECCFIYLFILVWLLLFTVLSIGFADL